MVRVAALLSAIVLAVLLGWTVASTFAEPPLVTPTGGVTNNGPQDTLAAGPNAEQALMARAQAQRWRDTAPPPDAARPTGHPRLPSEPAGEPQQQVQRWLEQRQVNYEVLREGQFISGVVPLSDPRAAVLEQPQGRVFRRLHNDEITHGGGWVIFGTGLILALFLLLRGRIGIREGPSGERIERFNAFERGTHWMTVTGFTLLALTGLILIYGKIFLKPLMGAGAYSALAEGSAYVHIAAMFPFVLGVIVMAAMWTRQNILDRYDLEWLRRGGGFFSKTGPEPPATRFNAGQKMIFWFVVLAGLLMLVSGISLMFPFFWLDVVGMQWTLIAHSALGLVFIAVIIAHIYIGTVGMQGAFDAMWSGDVDRNWLKEHHSVWFENFERESRGGSRQPRTGPAE